MTRENASGVLLSVLSEGAIYWREIAFNFNIEERLLLILIASGWILLAHDKRKRRRCSALRVVKKSAGLERLDLIDFSVILCIEKEGKKCQKKVMIWESQKVEMWKHI